jgi:integrase
MANKLKLTSTLVERLREPGIYWDSQIPGLGIRVSASGRKTYFYLRRVKGRGKQRNVTLARHGDPVLVDGVLRSFPFGADDARAKAATMQAMMLAGIDPVQLRKDEEAAAVSKAEQARVLSTTLQEVIDHYLEHHRVKGLPLRPKTKKDYREFMERYFADWLPKPCAPINRSMCLERFTQIEAKSAGQVHKATTYLSLFLNHAREMHADPDTGEYTILAKNPVERARKIKSTAPHKPRDWRIPARKVGAAWSFLRQRATNAVKELDRTAADWVSTLLLTGWRASECAALEWAWIDFDAKTVKLPGDMDPESERGFAGVKTHAEVTYPLSDALHAILKGRSELKSKDARYVFPARADNDLGHIRTAHGTMDLLAKAVGIEPQKIGKHWRRLAPHDLRRTAEDAALACKIDYALRQRLLNHKPQGVHDSSYGNDPSPEVLRPAVNAIANYILDAAKVYDAQQSGANVVNLADLKRG